MNKIIFLDAKIGVDSIGRIVNVLRKGKVKFQEINMKFSDENVSVYIKLDGELNEIEWLTKKLYRLADVENVKVVEDG